MRLKHIVKTDRCLVAKEYMRRYILNDVLGFLGAFVLFGLLVAVGIIAGHFFLRIGVSVPSLLMRIFVYVITVLILGVIFGLAFLAGGATFSLLNEIISGPYRVVFNKEANKVFLKRKKLCILNKINHLEIETHCPDPYETMKEGKWFYLFLVTSDNLRRTIEWTSKKEDLFYLAGQIAEFLGVDVKKSDWSEPVIIDIKMPWWIIRVRDFGKFLAGLPKLVPEGKSMYLEIRYLCICVEEFYKENKVKNLNNKIIGQFGGPLKDTFTIALTPKNCLEMADVLKTHGISEVVNRFVVFDAIG
ncbi:MAG: hypothetical protein FJZ16_05505, partial [Candidatus Omnitrophica bacterium]|nr:hypothetical protein [Candidatus Omnitrophota bacterium]